jgi:phospholipase/lecithinase/hemolysin
MSMLRIRALTVIAAAVLAACGGSDPEVPGSGAPAGAPSTAGSFSAVVSFGDSLSDIGTYSPATSLTANGQPPYFGGKFTANGAGGTVWVENLATQMGIATTLAEMGFAGQSVKCPAAAMPALANSCTAYAQGGARVTSADGIGKASGALTVPLKTQIANHLARFTSFKASDLVLVWSGNNDVFVQFSAFAAAAAQVQADAAAGRITQDEASRRLFTAQSDAQRAVKQAAQELTGYVRAEILAKGARYVAIMNLPDSAQSPFGSTLPSSARGVLTTLVETFNLWLRDGLTDQPVKIIDQFTKGREVYASPGQFGFVNNQVPTCDAAKIAAITGGQVTDGSSLFCNSTQAAPYYGLRDGASVTTWQFADGVHPTPGGHKVISDYVAQQLRAFGWI